MLLALQKIQVGQNFLPKRFFGRNLNLLEQKHVFVGNQAHQVGNYLMVEGTVVRAYVQYPVKGKEQSSGRGSRLEGNSGILAAAAHKGFAEQLGIPHDGKNGKLSPEVFLQHVDLPGENHADIGDIFTLQKNEFVLLIFLFCRLQTFQHWSQMVFADS